MTKNNLLFGIVGLFLGLVIGFVASNKLNRQEIVSENPAPNLPTANAPASATQVENVLVKDQNQKGGMIPAVAETLDNAEKEPNDFDAQIKAGDMYLRIQRFDKAVEFYEKASKIKPEDYETIVKIGNTNFDAKQFEAAEKWYEKALQIKPDVVGVRTDLGITFVERSNPDFDRAIKEFQTSLQNDPNHEQTLYNLAVAYYKKGNSEQVNSIIAKLNRINPNSELAQRLSALK